jgi:Ca2+-binding EF-hand superfamily protein
MSEAARWNPFSINRGPSEDELKAIFYQADTDLSGEIDREELSSALFTIGYRIKLEDYNDIFDEVDDDGSGSITFDEFKLFISKTKSQTFKSQTFAMELFKRFDIDEGGTIDKFEFAALAEEVERNYKRRTLLTAAAAAVGAVVVAKYNTEYAFAQKTFRGFYIEKKAEAAQRRFFPGALLSSDVDAAIVRTLGSRGYTPANTLFAHSVCSDEVNAKAEQLVNLMVSRWGEGFTLGGLGGLPFAGKSGFRAYLHHAPDSGKLLIMFAPHVGIDGEGRVGALQREGQTALSKACGAALGAYKAIQTKGGTAKYQASAVKDLRETDYKFDPELGSIINLLTPRLKGVENAPDPIPFVTYQMYTMVRDLLDNCFKGTDDVWEWVTEVALVGGIMINRKSGGDFFQPLSFEIRTQAEDEDEGVRVDSVEDVFVQAFGPRPDLLDALGSEGPVKAVLYPEGSVELESYLKGG